MEMHDFNLMPSKIHETGSVSTDTADGEVVRAAQDSVMLSLTSIKAVVAARETSRKICDF